MVFTKLVKAGIVYESFSSLIRKIFHVKKG